MATVTYLGHSCFELRTDDAGIIIDPFLSGNPLAQTRPEDVAVQWIIVTHGHGDHWGDTESIAKANDATVIACHELSNYAARQGLKTHGMSIGGGHDFPFGRVQWTVAHHGGGGGEGDLTYLGNPAGVLITLGGRTIYHAGDTALTYDMKLLGEFHEVELALLPIGDNYTMGIPDAVRAASFVRARTVVPMHYNTFDVVRADPEEFAARVRQETDARPVVLGIGDALEI